MKNQLLLTNVTKQSNSLLKAIIDRLYYPTQAGAGLYTIILTGLLLYVLYSIYFAYKLKTKYEKIVYRDQHLVASIRKYKERILCFWITLLLLLFEIGFSIHYNITGFISIFYFSKFNPQDLNISSNCQVKGGTFLADIYETRENFGIVYRSVTTQGKVCFFLFSWFFSVLLIHLNFAARDLHKPRTILYWILLGVLLAIFISVLIAIPWTSLFGIFLETALSQLTLFLAIYTYRKFTVSMKMRINDAYHSRNEQFWKSQEHLFKLYKFIIPMLMFVFEFFILIHLVGYNGFLLFETLAVNSCWFRVTLGIESIIKLSQQTIAIMSHIAYFCLLAVRILDIAFFSLNLIILCCFFLKVFLVVRRQNRKQVWWYRYNSVDVNHLTSSLLSTHGRHTQ